MNKFKYSSIKTLVFETTTAKELRGCMSKKQRPYLVEVKVYIPKDVRSTITNGYTLTKYVETITNLFVLKFLKFNNKLIKDE